MARASPGLACGPQMSAVALELEWGTPPKSPLYSFLGNSPSLACQGEGWSRAVWYRPGHSQAVPVLPATGPMLSLAMWTPVLCPAYPCQSAQAKSSFRKFPHQLLDNCASLEPRTETVTPMSVLPPPPPACLPPTLWAAMAHLGLSTVIAAFCLVHLCGPPQLDCELLVARN